MLLLVHTVLAAYPEDVSLLAMDDFYGQSTLATTGDDYVTTGYRTLVGELGSTITNPMMTPAETLGVNGFYVGVANTFSFTRTGSLDGETPAGWNLADPDEEPPAYLFLPWVQVRKGLPASFEVGANFGWIGLSRTGALGGFARFAPMEGFRRIPDFAIQVGYTGYVGNDELELGVFDTAFTLGYTVPFGVTQGIHQASFSPYFSVGQSRIHAAPRVDLTGTDLEGRITELSGFKSSDVFEKEFAPWRIGGGFRIVNGDYTATVAATHQFGSIPTVSLAFGFTY